MSWMELSGGQFISMRRSLLEESYTNVTRMSPDSMSGFLRLCYSKDTKEMKEVTKMAFLEVSCLKKIYTTRLGGSQVRALSNVCFSAEQGEYVAIM